MNKCRCDERLQTKTKEFTRLPYTRLILRKKNSSRLVGASPVSFALFSAVKERKKQIMPRKCMPTTQLLLCCALICVLNIMSAYAGLPSSPWPTIQGDKDIADSCLSLGLVAFLVCIQFHIIVFVYIQVIRVCVYAHSVFGYVCNTCNTDLRIQDTSHRRRGHDHLRRRNCFLLIIMRKGARNARSKVCCCTYSGAVALRTSRSGY